MANKTINGYHHAVPGRVRVRVSNLKNDHEAAKSLELLLSSQPGVTQVKANVVTGNVLVRFDPDQLSYEDIMIALGDLGYIPIMTKQEKKEMADFGWVSGLGTSVGISLAKVALKQALKGHPAGIILELI